MLNLTNLTDKELLSLYTQHGHTYAFDVLIKRHKEKIYASIFLLVNNDKYLAEDLFQNVFIRIIDTLNTGHYAEQGKFLPWAMRIAHNICVDHFRKVKRAPPIVRSNGENIFELLNFNMPSPEQKMMKNQSHENVRKMIEMLDEDQREVVILRHYAELSFKEIAELTKCSINTALGRMRYGLINIRKMIVEKQIDL